MIIPSYSNIDIIQGVIGYGNSTEGITDWRIENSRNGVFNILNSSSQTPRFTIIENGNIGIGTIPISSSSKLDVGGNINIIGIYKKNNRDVLNDTSNYVLSTSNILVNRIVDEVRFGSNYVSRINTELNIKIDNTSNYVATTNNILANRVSNSQWISVNSGIYYNKAIPIATSTPQPLLITNELGTVRTMVFTYTGDTISGSGQTQYTINIPANITCDILIIGGGGAGGDSMGGGGGAGGVVYAINQMLSASTYKVNVGRGGIGGSTAEEEGTAGIDQDGKESSLMNSDGSSYISLTLGGVSQQLRGYGGGGGGVYFNALNGRNGGSGGGCTENNPGFGLNTPGSATQPATYWNGTAYVVGGKAGRQNTTTTQDYQAGGGGGLGELSSDYRNGNAGVEINITGTSKFYAAGGGAGQYIGSSTTAGLGGSSIGGNGRIWTGGAYAPAPRDVATSGVDGTGSGGGGTAYAQAPVSIAGSGGSGIVIIRYVLPAGNVGIGTTNPISKLHVYDDTTNATTLTIQNNYTEPVTIFPSTGYALAETIENNIYYRTLTFTYSLLKNYPIIPPIPGDPVNTTLLAWYRFNGDGLDYNTSATKYNLIANVGTPTYSSGTTAYSFFQGLRYINTGTGSLRNTSLSLASRAFSIAVWVRINAVDGVIYINQTVVNDTNKNLHIGKHVNNSYFIAFYGNDLACGTGVSGIPTSYPGDLNTWVHLVYVVLPNYNRRIYRNGVLIATDINTAAFSGSGDLIIGTGVNSFLSDLRIYTTGLSATDVATLYASYTPLLAWYRFDGDGLDYNQYATKFNLIAEEGTVTYSLGTTTDSFFQGRRYINTSTGSLKNTTISLASRAFSVSMWLRFKTTGQGASILCQSITQTTNTTLYIGARGNASYFLGFHGNDLECGIGVPGSPTSYPGDVNIWVHLVYVVLPNYNRRIYRNGILISADSNTSAFTGTGDLSFNRRYWNGNAYVNMDVSDLRIYTVGLSATDVATLYASYSNIVTNDNYSVNFANTSKILVNGASKTVNGMYSIYTGDSNSSMLPLSNQSDIPLATTTSSGTSSVVVKYAYNQNILPPIITGSGITSTIVGNTDVCSIFTYTGTPATNTNTTYTFTTTEPYICDILIIGGGGAGGQWMGAGGGAGGVVYVVNQILPPGRYSVRVGRGGIGADGNAASWIYGADQDGIESSLMNSTGSSYISLTLGGISRELRGFGGGGGGTYNIPQNTPGRNGGSGGGTMETNDNGYILGTIGLATQPATLWNGASYVAGGSNGRQNTLTVNDIQGGGGGGAGAVAANYTNGNSGVSINITGKSQFYAAGGGAGQYINTSMSAGLGGSSIGGNGCIYIASNNTYGPAPRDFATSGTNGTGSGGGGGRFQTLGFAGSGGSGVVIIRYRKMTSASFELINVENNIINREPIIPGTTVVAIPGTLYKYILFPYTITTSGLTGQTQYTFTATEDINCEILVVAGGGGGGGGIGGGGGAGAVVYIPSGTLSAGSYTIRVGNGGIGGSNWESASANGYNSSISGSFGTIIAEGGGGVTKGHDAGDGNIGGSGGGAAGPNSVLNYGGAAGTSSSLGGFTGFIYGNRGGNNTATRTGNITNASGGGGAGSAAADTNPNGTAGGNGGAGILINITGNNNYYGGGGGGSGYAASGGSGGIGGGGDGVRENLVGYPGAPNTGGGGGGGGWQTNSGGSGGSGVVIIRYLITKNLTTNYKIGNYNGDFKIISSVSSSVSSTQSSTFSSSDIDYMRITGNGASIYNPTGSPLWSTVSDRRIKENIEKASYDKCYDNINKLELYRFNYIKELNNINKDYKQLGYIAQEVKDIFPKAVSSHAFNNNSLSIPDLLSIDISQINYSLYGTVRKLIELDKKKEARIKKMEYLLNIDTIESINPINEPVISTSNIILYILTNSNVIIDITTSNNISLYTSNNSIFEGSVLNSLSFYKPPIINFTIDTVDSSLITCNLLIDTIDTSLITSNLFIDSIDTPLITSNLLIDTVDSSLITSNLVIDTIDTSLITCNLLIDTIDTSLITSNLVIDTIDTSLITSNLFIDTIDTSLITSNLFIDTVDSSLIMSNLVI